MKKRIFIALLVSDSVKSKITKLQKKFSGFKGVRWEVREKLHITLHFLGYLTNNEIEQVKDVLTKIEFKDFKAILNGFAFFPSVKQARVVVLKIESENKIEKLQNLIGEKLKKYRFFKLEKRKFKAHLTFGRVKSISEKEIKLIEKERISGSWLVQEIDLMQSILRGKLGSKYNILEKYVLWKK